MKTLRYVFATLLILLGLTSIILPVATVSAAPVACQGGWEHLKTDEKVCCPQGSGGDARDCFFAKYLNPTIRVLSFVAGLAAVIGITIGGIQYAASGGDPQKTAAGKGKVIKALYGLLAFLFLYSALQFLSPGGIGANPTPSGSGSTVAQQCSKPFLGLKPWFAYLPNEAFATGSCNLDEFKLFGKTGDGKQSNLVPVVLAIADDLVRIAGMVAVVYVLVGSVQYVTSNGEPDRTKRARETIINALVGVVIAIIAVAVVSYIGNKLSS